MEKAAFDVKLRRRLRKYSRVEQFGRCLWWIGQWLFFLTPRPLWCARVLLLRSFGANVGKGVRIYPTVRIQIPWNLDIGDAVTVGDRVNLYALGRIQLGARTTISQNVHLCAGTHAFEDTAFTLIRLPITLEDDVWICADAFIGPNTRIARGAVVGARAVVMKDVDPNSIVAGNPARFIRTRKNLNDHHESEN